MATELLNTPKFAPGQFVAESLRDSVRVAVTPVVTYDSSGGGTVTTVMRVPANTLVLGVLAETSEGFAAAVGPAVINLGDSDSATALFASSDYTITSTGFAASFKGKVYTSAQDLLATFSNASSDSTAGAIRWWVMYSTEIDKRRVN